MSVKRLTVVLVPLLVLAGAAGAVYWMYYLPRSAEQLLRAGNQSLNQGARALADKEPALAQTRYDEAKIYAERALERLDQESRAQGDLTKEELNRFQELAGKAFYLKAVAMRDQAYAKAMADGKEASETLDSTTGKKFRNFLVVSEVKALGEVLGALEQASLKLPHEEEVQNETLRTFVQIQPYAWEIIHTSADNLVQMKPDDSRALYMLARFNFEQPQLKKGQPFAPATAAGKRSRSRVNQAMEYLTRLKQIKDYPMWRTLLLEAEVRQWLAQDYAVRGDENKAKKEREALVALLFGSDGALEKARRFEGLHDPVSPSDADGALGAHLVALDQAVDENRRTGTGVDKVAGVLKDTQAFCKKVTDDKVGGFAEEKVGSTLVAALEKAQGTLALERTREWRAAVDAARPVLKAGLEKGSGSMRPYAEYADVLQREAMLAGKAADLERQAQMQKQARAWVEEALKVAEARKADPVQQVELQVLAAEMKYATEGTRASVAPHLKALQESKAPQAQGLAELIEGVIDEREGRLEKARQHLEKAADAGNPSLALRAHMALSSVYLAMGEPDKALASLRQLDKVYERFDELSPQERAWAQQFLRGPDDLRVLIATAHLETARLKMTKFLSENPTKKPPTALVDTHEREAVKLINKLPPQSKAMLLGKQMVINYLASTARRAEAEKMVAKLRTDFPDNVGLLRVEANLLLQRARETAGDRPLKEVEKEVIPQIDLRIRDFIKQFPEERVARLLWATWLARTARADEALAYLNDPANLPGPKDDAFQRVLATVHLAKGEPQAGIKILEQMPQDPLLDAALIQAGASLEAKQQSARQAIARHDANGLFRIWNAELTYQAGKYADAARDFYNALDFTRLKASARAGLQKSLIALAATDPAAARRLATEMVQEDPAEPALLLGYAHACLGLDDIGRPGDNWELTKNMASAMAAWEQAILKTNPDRTQTTLTKADLWARANQPELARAELMRALKLNPEDHTTLQLAISLDLAVGSKDRVQSARNFLEALKKQDADAPATVMAEAQVLAAEGHPEQAIKALETLVDKRPKEAAGAYPLLISLYRKQKDAGHALASARKWSEQFPDSHVAAAAEIEQLARAEKVDDARKRADDFTKAQVERLTKQAQEVKLTGAKDPEKIRQAMVDDARWLVEFELARAFLRGLALDEAEARAQKLLKEQAEQTAAVLMLGDIRLARKSWQDAAKVYAQVVEKDKGNQLAGNNLAWILATQLKKPNEALEVLREVSKGRYSGKTLPGDRLHPELLDTLGTVYLMLGGEDLHTQMKPVFEAALKRYPRDPRIHLYLGHAYAGLGNPNMARQLYQMAIKLAAAADNPMLTPVQYQEVTRAATAAQKQLP
jgi:lipopolysaccharide biosynthesis regulator YciM